MFFHIELKRLGRSVKLTALLLYLAMALLYGLPSMAKAEESRGEASAAVEQEDSAAGNQEASQAPEKAAAKKPGSSLRYCADCGVPMFRIEYGKPDKDSESSGEWEFTMGSMF